MKLILTCGPLDVLGVELLGRVGGLEGEPLVPLALGHTQAAQQCVDLARTVVAHDVDRVAGLVGKRHVARERQLVAALERLVACDHSVGDHGGLEQSVTERIVHESS